MSKAEALCPAPPLRPLNLVLFFNVLRDSEEKRLDSFELFLEDKTLALRAAKFRFILAACMGPLRIDPGVVSEHHKM